MFDLYFAPCKDIRIPESGKFLLVDPESGKILLMESGIQGFGIRNTVSIPLRNEILNPSSPGKDWNPVPGIQNPFNGFQNCIR